MWEKSFRNDFHTSTISVWIWVWDISFILWHAGELPSNIILHNEFHGNVSFLIGEDSDDEISPGVLVYIVPLCLLGLCGWQEMTPDSDDSGEVVSQQENICNKLSGGRTTELIEGAQHLESALLLTKGEWKSGLWQVTEGLNLNFNYQSTNKIQGQFYH